MGSDKGDSELCLLWHLVSILLVMTIWKLWHTFSGSLSIDPGKYASRFVWSLIYFLRTTTSDSSSRIDTASSHRLYPGECTVTSVQLLIGLFSKYSKICMATKDDFYWMHHQMMGFVGRSIGLQKSKLLPLIINWHCQIYSWLSHHSRFWFPPHISEDISRHTSCQKFFGQWTQYVLEMLALLN